MALKVQSSFAAGELDPALWRRTTFEKYKAGLARARNVLIGKTGRVMSRMGRSNVRMTKLDYRRVLIYVPEGTNYVIEWGHKYVRSIAYHEPTLPSSYNAAGLLVLDEAHDWTEDQLDEITFEFVNHKTYGWCIFAFRPNVQPLVFSFLPGGGFITSSSIFSLPAAPTNGTRTEGGTGYNTAYVVTRVVDGEESTTGAISGAAMIPINAGEQNVITARLHTGTTNQGDTEMRVYRRPLDGGDYGYIGSSSTIYTSGGNTLCDFVDLGQAADYTRTPPAPVLNFSYRGGSDPRILLPQTGIIYQQRLLIGYGDRLIASRTGYVNNFYRDYPLAADSSLAFKTGSSGYAYIYRLLDSDGLVAFTSNGIYLGGGPLSPTNLALTRKGKWIIDPAVPPLAIPGGALFVDKATNTVRNLAYSEEAQAYSGEELSIFSNHLFTSRRVVSWGFHQGETPCLIVVFSDGKFATFTFERDHEMKAWTSCDSAVNVEMVAETGVAERTFFLVENQGFRYIEVTNGRYVSAEDLSENPEADKGVETALMDSIVTYNGILNGSLRGDNTAVALSRVGTTATATLVRHGLSVGDSITIYSAITDATYEGTFTVASVPTADTFTYTMLGTPAAATDSARIDIEDQFVFEPNAPNDWDGPLTLYCGGSGIFTSPGPGAVGEVLRIFDEDGCAIDLTVTARANVHEITVQPSLEFPEDYATGAQLYRTANELTGHGHMAGEEVAVMVDGYVVCSPNNDDQNYPTLIPDGGGLITLPGDLRAAIAHVGRPITCDVKTLRIDTVEQRPVLMESITVNKIIVDVHKSRGLYIANKLPEGDSVVGMEDIDTIVVDYDQENPIIANRFTPAKTREIELTLPGEWSTGGEIALRQVDPVHFEVLSITPDLDDQRR